MGKELFAQRRQSQPNLETKISKRRTIKVGRGAFINLKDQYVILHFNRLHWL